MTVAELIKKLIDVSGGNLNYEVEFWSEATKERCEEGVYDGVLEDYTSEPEIALNPHGWNTGDPEKDTVVTFRIKIK